jgi:hypothetical protein
MEEREHLLFVFGRTVRPTHSHAAEADGGDFEIVAEFALLHEDFPEKLLKEMYWFPTLSVEKKRTGWVTEFF